MFATLNRIEIPLLLELNNILPRYDALVNFFRFFSIEGLTVFVWLIIMICFFIWGERKHVKFTLLFVIPSALTAIFVNLILKNIFIRSRPWLLLGLENVYCPSDFSFPSGHAASAFAGAVIFSHFDPKRTTLYYFVAILISFSRLYLYCHFFTDVAFGALIGASISQATIFLLSDNKFFKDTQGS